MTTTNFGLESAGNERKKELTMSKDKNMLGVSPGNDHLGLVIDFASKLRSGAITPIVAKRFLRGEVSQSAFLVWKTVRLGTGLVTLDDFRRAFKDDGFGFCNFGSDILGSPAFTVSSEKTEVDLVSVSVSELGFKDGAIRADIYKRAKELGLQLVPAEVGPQLRMQYPDQPRDEWLGIGMDPILDLSGHRLAFYVVHDEYGLWLGGHNSDLDHFWANYRHFVFVLP